MKRTSARSRAGRATYRGLLLAAALAATAFLAAACGPQSGSGGGSHPANTTQPGY